MKSMSVALKKRLDVFSSPDAKEAAFHTACAKMEQFSDDELDHAAEEDSDKEDQDLDKMFGAWLGELDKLTKSLDDGRPEKVQKAPLRQETNMANMAYRFSIYNINEALNQSDAVDLDALMADLCSIEQELSTIGKPSSTSSRLGLTGDTKVRQKPPAGRSHSTKHTGSSSGGASSSGGSTSSSTRASPASTVRVGSSSSRPPLASNFSLDDITAQLEKASQSMDETARQSSTSFSSTVSAPYSSSTMRRPTSHHHHRRTGSVGTVTEHEVRSFVHSSRSSINSASASSMDSLDIEKPKSDQDGLQDGQDQPSSEHSYLDRETSLILKSIAGKPSHLLTKEEQAAKQKAEKIRVALEKIKEAQVKKLVIRVHLSDESSKTVMVDERQTVRQVLDSLLDKSHCGYSLDWSLVEIITELQTDKGPADSMSRDQASRDLVCFLQLDHVNVYLGQDYRSKYKAPTDYCMVLKHPQIQKKSQYIKYLCCDDVRMLHQWVNGIRIAKYGKQLYLNYQEAMRRTEAAHDWSSLSSSSIKSGSSSSSLPESQSNHSSQSDSGVSETTSSGHVRSQSVVSSIFSEAWKRGNQADEPKMRMDGPPAQPARASYPLQLPQLPQSLQSRCSYSGVSPVSPSSPPSPPPPPPPPPPLPNPTHHSTNGLQQFLAQKFPNMTYDFSPVQQDEEPPPPPPVCFSPPPQQSGPPAPPKTFTGGFPPQTAPKPAHGISPISPVPPSLSPTPPATMKKQQSLSSGHSPNQPPPILPKQYSLSSKAASVSAPISPTQSLVKQIVNQFPDAPDGSKCPISPPVVKTKPKWQPGGQAQPQSPEFPPPPPESTLEFPPPPAPSPPPAPQPSGKMGSPIKKSPSTSSNSSTGSGGKKPPPTPQRNSSMMSTSSIEYQESKKVEDLVSMFAQTSQAPPSSFSTPSSTTGSPSKDSSAGPRKPGKINLANLPLALQGKPGQYQQSSSDFPSPPPECDFPPPPPDSELLPPPPLPSELHTGAPKVAVVNPQPQHSSSSTSSWKQSSLKKMPPPTMHRRSSGPPEPLALSPPPQQMPLSSFNSQIPPTSPKASLSIQPNFLEDLNRTLKRKSMTRHGSLTSSRISAKLEPVTTMDDMALPPPPPELLLGQQKKGGYMSANISGYATLRRGPPPAPPKRDQNTKLTSEW
ncbi:ras-associated and pleckstrin homology domains-containing protein 1-like [Sinocyclocheilus rhinocerous]|uniref:ras-associated and pleckstrin homology domains-containing protein 1-like n=1 Tax=Sinocyclocheilus rhinocerous TaxID=307959 RepID=UPI0007B8E8B8|nr:PREDICTED: ras-associated and pleckstrin homology domains-containing protein 1-like [Sinocyclocheilus rhinocerous]